MQLSRTNLLLIPVALGLAGSVITLGVSYSMRPQYKSASVIELRMPESDDSRERNLLAIQEIIKLQSTMLSRLTLYKIIRSHDLYREDFLRKPPEDIINDMRRFITVEPLTKGGKVTAFAMSFQYEDPRLAQSVVQDLTAETLDSWVAADAQSVRDGQPKRGTLDLIDPPSLPTKSISHNYLSISLAGLAGGIVTGGLLAIALRFLKRRNPANPPSTPA